MKKYSVILVLIAFLMCHFSGISASRDSILISTEYDYYSNEDTANILVFIPSGQDQAQGSILYMNDSIVFNSLSEGLNRIPMRIVDWVNGKHLMQVEVQSNTLNKHVELVLRKLEPKFNEVKINRVNGHLLVDGLPWYPFGFYSYSPVQPTLAEEEVVRGFNMMSPYQKIEGKTLNERKIYMDRCARLGMKVHYNLLSVSGGGGVGSGRLNGLELEEKQNRLINEINTFKDHPALLGWYISDEPVGQGVPPEPLIEMYRFIKELDPYHPVSIVFMTPQKARLYADAMDIVMADPYPVPSSSITSVGRIIRNLTNEFYLEKSVWIVPQAFGGNEWWAREPTAQELRSMTYQAIIEGAQGVQYFIRHGMNIFPKSVVAWNECSNMAHEIAELTPVLSHGVLAEGIKCNQRSVKFRALKYRSELFIVAVNIDNQPKEFRLTSELLKDYSKAFVLFENRQVKLQSGWVADQIGGYGTRVFRFVQNNSSKTDLLFHTFNMVVNPGFEQLSSPLIPSGTYARFHGDRGATFFVDPRVSLDGQHSLKLVTPKDRMGTALSFFPVELRNGSSYTIEIWAKAKPRDPDWKPYETNWFRRLFNRIKAWLKKEQKQKSPQTFELSLGSIGSKEFKLTNEWKRYAFSIYVDDLSSGMQRVNPILELLSEGTAWFDHLQVYPEMDIATMIENNSVKVTLSNLLDTGEIRYTTDSSLPGLSSKLYSEPFQLFSSAQLFASVFIGDSSTGTIYKELLIHDGIGARLVLEYSYHDRYQGIGNQTLVDGSLGSKFFRDKAWLGFYNKDLVVTIDLEQDTQIRDIQVSFLRDHKVDIFLPSEIRIELSPDGIQFNELWVHMDIESLDGPPERFSFSRELDGQQARYIKIFAKNREEWLFVDEVVVNRR